MREIEITKEDVYKYIYFITAIIQRQSSAMTGSLSSRGDLIGGIFDRWINTVPESLLFNKIILPKITTKPIKIISDYYLYEPQKVGIAPDVLGLEILGKIVPFAVFNDSWVAIRNMPQIEIKTFKKKQKLVSLRDQGYSGKYLVMAETALRIDYLLPFFNENIFSNNVYESLKMDDSVFIQSNKEHNVNKIDKIDMSTASIGSVKLLKITDVDSFTKYATFCDHNISIQYVKDVELKTRKPNKINLDEPLSNYCQKDNLGFYDFLLKLHNDFAYKTTKFHINNIEYLKIIKKNKNNIYIEVLEEGATFNNVSLSVGYYKITFDCINRSSNNGTEYFLQKDLINYIPDKEETLKNILKNIIDSNS